jgi:hypothetical protein
MKNYTLVNSDGTEIVADVIDINEIKEFIEGDIEHIGNIYCNDDGIRMNLPRNIKYPNFLGNIIIENR